MALDPHHYAQLANCLDYPREDIVLGARLTSERFREDAPELADALAALADWLGSVPLQEAQERYTTLFDLNPVATLSITHHIWGDTYQRGAFLAEMARELRVAGIDPGEELPDHLPTVLRLMERINDLEDLRVLVENIVLPALEKMSERLESSKHPWAAVLRSMPEMLRSSGWEARRQPLELHVLGGASEPDAGCGAKGGCRYA